MFQQLHKTAVICVTSLLFLLLVACTAAPTGASNALASARQTSSANPDITVMVHPYRTPNTQYVVGQAIPYDLATLSSADFGGGTIGAQWTINWGDQTPPTHGSGVPNSGSFEVYEAHAYSHKGSYTVTITAMSVGVFPVAMGTGTGVITVVDVASINPGITVDVHPYPAPSVRYVAGQATAYDLATLSSIDFGGGAIGAQWTINWGDQTPPTQGSETPYSVSFDITSGHAYSQSGTYTVTITAMSVGVFPIARGTGTSVITVVSNTLTVNKQSGVVEQPLQGIIATGHDIVFNETLNGTVNWGDNSASNVQAISGASGNFQVSATHTYTQPGTYTITVSLSNGDQETLQGTATATIVPAFYLKANIIKAQAGQGFHLNVATITGTVSSAGLKVEILWGDNSGSRLVINGGTGTIQIPAGHIYSQPGTYTISIAVKDLGTGEVEQAFGSATVTN